MRRPDVVQAVLTWLSAALLAAVLYVEGAETIAWTSGRPLHWSAGLSGLVGGAIGGVMARLGQRQRYGADLWRQYRYALRSGRLPENVDRIEWSRLLSEKTRALQVAARILYPMAALLGALWLLLTVNGRLQSLSVFVAVGLTVAVLIVVFSRLWLRGRLVELWEQLPSAEDGEPAG